MPALASSPNTDSRPHPVVLQVLPALEMGAVEQSTIDVALFLRRAGGTPLVVSEGGRLVHLLERAGITHLTLPMASKNPFVMRANIKRLMQIMADHQVDIVHARSRAPAWSAFIAARRMNIPFLTTYHAAYKYTHHLKKLYNSVMARGDLVIAISNFIYEQLITTHGVSPQRVRTIPRGIDLFKFNPDHVTAERMATLTHQWRLVDGMKIILCPARLDEGKGQMVLLDALALLKAKRQDFICILAGAEEEESAAFSSTLEDHAVALGLEGHVKMMGDCPDRPTAMMLADVVVAPSIVPEGFGRIAIEAQAMGRPVIASRLGAMVETMIEGQTGWLVEAQNPAALAEALDTALNLTTEQRARLGARAISHVHSLHSKDNMCWLTLDVYQELYNGSVPWAMPPS